MLSNQEGNEQGFVSVPPIMNTYFMFDDMANSYLYLVAGLQLMSKSLNPLEIWNIIAYFPKNLK